VGGDGFVFVAVGGSANVFVAVGGDTGAGVLLGDGTAVGGTAVGGTAVADTTVGGRAVLGRLAVDVGARTVGLAVVTKVGVREGDVAVVAVAAGVRVSVLVADTTWLCEVAVDKNESVAFGWLVMSSAVPLIEVACIATVGVAGGGRCRQSMARANAANNRMGVTSTGMPTTIRPRGLTRRPRMVSGWRGTGSVRCAFEGDCATAVGAVPIAIGPSSVLPCWD
jgi:hypothetical protein